MPIPTPKKGENNSKFMSRCVSDETMRKEFKNIKQRIAVCIQQKSKKEKS